MARTRPVSRATETNTTGTTEKTTNKANAQPNGKSGKKSGRASDAQADRDTAATRRITAARLPPELPELTLSAAAWIKLQYLCHRCETEVGAFGLSSETDPLYIEDVRTVAQRCTEVSVAFDDAAVADFFEDQAGFGRGPSRCGRVWIHTHPGDSAEPSGLDERTFDRVFGACDWAVMLILARGGQLSCRLRLNAGTHPGPRVSLSREIPVRVDYRGLIDPATGDGEPEHDRDQDHNPTPFGLRPDVWDAELAAHVTREMPTAESVVWSPDDDPFDRFDRFDRLDGYGDGFKDWLDDGLDDEPFDGPDDDEAWQRWLVEQAYWFGQCDEPVQRRHDDPEPICFEDWDQDGSPSLYDPDEADRRFGDHGFDDRGFGEPGARPPRSRLPFASRTRSRRAGGGS